GLAGALVAAWAAVRPARDAAAGLRVAGNARMRAQDSRASRRRRTVSNDGPPAGRSARPAPLHLVGCHLLGRGVLDLLRLRHLELILLLHDGVVQRGVILEDVGDRDLLEDRLPGAFGLAGAAVDALVGMDVELVRELLGVGP